MKRQQGISTMAAVVIAALVAGGGVGAVAWQQHQQLVQTRTQLAETQAQLQTATSSLNAARTQLATMKKELDEQKLALDQVRAERDSAKVLLDAEKQYGERIRAELTLAREQLAFMRSRQTPTYARPQAIQPQIIRVVPAPGGSAIGAARIAPAPAQAPQ